MFNPLLCLVVERSPHSQGFIFNFSVGVERSTPYGGEGGEWRVMYSRPKQGGYEEERVVQVNKGRFQKKN